MELLLNQVNQSGETEIHTDLDNMSELSFFRFEYYVKFWDYVRLFWDYVTFKSGVLDGLTSRVRPI